MSHKKTEISLGNLIPSEDTVLCVRIVTKYLNMAPLAPYRLHLFEFPQLCHTGTKVSRDETYTAGTQ
jgi:hypothetical protein